jgi:hypothetical protein
MARSERKGIRFHNYEILTDTDNWILRTWSPTKPKNGQPAKTGGRYRDRFYPTLHAVGEKIADLEARKLVYIAGMELQSLGKALGEKLAALEDEIRAECYRVKARPAA